MRNQKELRIAFDEYDKDTFIKKKSKLKPCHLFDAGVRHQFVQGHPGKK